MRNRVIAAAAPAVFVAIFVAACSSGNDGDSSTGTVLPSHQGSVEVKTLIGKTLLDAYAVLGQKPGESQKGGAGLSIYGIDKTIDPALSASDQPAKDAKNLTVVAACATSGTGVSLGTVHSSVANERGLVDRGRRGEFDKTISCTDGAAPSVTINPTSPTTLTPSPISGSLLTPPSSGLTPPSSTPSSR